MKNSRVEHSEIIGKSLTLRKEKQVIIYLQRSLRFLLPVLCSPVPEVS